MGCFAVVQMDIETKRQYQHRTQAKGNAQIGHDETSLSVQTAIQKQMNENSNPSQKTQGSMGSRETNFPTTIAPKVSWPMVVRIEARRPLCREPTGPIVSGLDRAVNNVALGVTVTAKSGTVSSGGSSFRQFLSRNPGLPPDRFIIGGCAKRVALREEPRGLDSG
jgi:hypothetical protein